MNPFQEKIAAWLSRNGPKRSLIQCFDLPIVLATDIGLQRSENQDRVAVLRIRAKGGGGGRSLIAVAVADGMGGMRDGGKCATLALSSFFYALTLHRAYDLEKRAAAAISYANDQVFRFAAGKGGSTLSSVLIDQDRRPFLVNIGDSRIYAFGKGLTVGRLTRDDSLAEAVGGHGRELLQFVGMGEGMQPHIASVAASIANLAITTDGIHFIESSTFESVLAHSLEIRSTSERLSALARWCGSPDNASSAIIDLQLLLQQFASDAENGVEIWDSLGSLTPIWFESDSRSAAGVAEGSAAFSQQGAPQQASPALDLGPKKRTKKAKAKKQVAPQKDDIQLEIQIEKSPDLDEADDNSR